MMAVYGWLWPPHTTFICFPLVFVMIAKPASPKGANRSYSNWLITLCPASASETKINNNTFTSGRNIANQVLMCLQKRVSGCDFHSWIWLLSHLLLLLRHMTMPLSVWFHNNPNWLLGSGWCHDSDCTLMGPSFWKRKMFLVKTLRNHNSDLVSIR